MARIEPDSQQLRRLAGQWRSVAGLYCSDFFPLTPYSTDSTLWIAWQFDSQGERSGLVPVFRGPDSAFEPARFRLGGLHAGANHSVRDLGTRQASAHTGKELMESGLEVTIKKRPGITNLKYRKVE